MYIEFLSPTAIFQRWEPPRLPHSWIGRRHSTSRHAAADSSRKTLTVQWRFFAFFFLFLAENKTGFRSLHRQPRRHVPMAFDQRRSQTSDLAAINELKRSGEMVWSALNKGSFIYSITIGKIKKSHANFAHIQEKGHHISWQSTSFLCKYKAALMQALKISQEQTCKQWIVMKHMFVLVTWKPPWWCQALRDWHYWKSLVIDTISNT